MVLFDDVFLSNATALGPLIKQGRADGVLSNLFPLIWLAMPAFWVGCALVRWIEGPRQSFNADEALCSLRNQLVLGALYSFGPTGNALLVNRDKQDMTASEWFYKTLVALVMVDAAFYWVHRAMHDIPVLRPLHARHHALLAKHTVWGGLDEDFGEMLAIFLYINCAFFVLPVTPEYITWFLAGGALQTAFMHGTRAGGWLFPPWPFVGALVHHEHHVTITRNFGGVLVFWDKLMGTEKRKQAAN